MCRNYGLPLHLVRELYETFRNFKARVADFIRYRRITSNMNDRFPDATAEELGRSAILQSMPLNKIMLLGSDVVCSCRLSCLVARLLKFFDAEIALLLIAEVMPHVLYVERR